MTKFINNIGNEFVNLWESFTTFIRDNHSNPFLWVVLIVGGISISMWTFNSLNKDGR